MIRARLALLGSAAAFGLMAVLARRLSRPDMGFTAGHLSVLRFAVGVVLCLIAFWIRPALHTPGDRRLLVLRGLSGGLVVVLYFEALARIPAGEAGIIYNLFPVLATLFALAFFRERPTVHLALALALATVGVGLVLGQGRLAISLGKGEGAAFGAALFAALSANAIRAARPRSNATTIFFWFSLVGIPVVLPFALDPWPRAPLAWALGLAMSLCALAAQVLMAEAYGALSVPEAAVWLQLTPVATYLFALPVLGEPIRAWGLAGILLAVGGVAYGTVLGHRR
ncbi:DMT family transporter [Mesoterricola sediminis]|uniref:EamA domain-containing protein n=1 Tax=Mesoterricola sediminis TaxID=2927980 RepID=A0AA48H3Y5_9BACT|nr:DMT family transporter [Mesoterricola sediminis]BDU75553.1 hypothetical protein METESE_05110 [Mesoterricola sediminis]